MVFFSKKPKKNKIYSLQDAMKLVSENEGYSVVEENGGYRVISDRIEREGIERYKSQISRRDEFKKDMQIGYMPNAVGTKEDSATYGSRCSYYKEER